MNASKVSFSQHTKEMLTARPLSQKHKMALRRQRIIEYIRELPYGECQKADLIMAAGYDLKVHQSYANGWAFIERLKKNKVIQMSDGSNLKNSYIKKWVVLADVRTIKPADDAYKVTNDHGKMTWPKSDGKKTVEVPTVHKYRGEGFTHSNGDDCLNEPIDIKRDGFIAPRPPNPEWKPSVFEEKGMEPDTIDLLEQAKNFAWNTNSDSLREFVAWVKR